jgi:adenosylcobinamide amidohydrolase
MPWECSPRAISAPSGWPRPRRRHPATCLATVGLSNAEAVGRRRPYHSADFGTINLCTAVDAALTEAAQLEALSIAIEARTAAVMEAGVSLPTGTATGTGTDCAALACDPGEGRYAGLHTAIGEAIGAATRRAITAAAADWKSGAAPRKNVGAAR